jgi:benzoate/toluate 1,2-dioxygenase beta subunit
MTETAAPLADSVATEAPAANGLLPVPDGVDIRDIEQFVYREARLADENDYDGWESLWTDDAIYWVPARSVDRDPLTQVSVIYDNRSRISTRMKQVKTGKRYAQAPASNLRRLVSNVELLGGRRSATGDVDVEVGANFLVFESRQRGNELWGGRATYRIRTGEDGLRLSYKKVVLVDHDKAIPTLGFLV